MAIEDSRDHSNVGGVRRPCSGSRDHRAPVRLAAPPGDRIAASLCGYQTGKTFLVDRHVLIGNLRRVAAGEEFGWESRRKERLDGAIDRLRRYQTAARVSIPVPPDVFSRKLKDLSPGLVLEPGHLHVTFSGAVDLLAKLFELARAASNDYDRFCAAAEPVDRRTA